MSFWSSRFTCYENINKGRFGGLKGRKRFKRNKKGAGKPLSYPIEINREILVRLLEMMDLHLLISPLALRKFTKSKIQPYCQELKQSGAGNKKLVIVMDLHYEDAI